MDIPRPLYAIMLVVPAPDHGGTVSRLFSYRPFDSLGWDVSVGNLVAALIALVAILAMSSLAQALLKRYARSHEGANQASLYTLSRILHYAIAVVAILVSFHVAGIPISQLAVFGGALGVGLGFGLQAIFSNFVAGLILLFDRSLKVGDFVELDGDTRGVVRSINIRSTRITTNDNIDVLVPNSEFVTKRLVNWTHASEHRRIRVPFAVGPDADKELVKKAALEAASRVPFTLSMEGRRQPQVWLEKFGDSSSDFVLAVWLTEAAARRNSAIRAAYTWELDTALRKYGIADSPSQLVVHLKSMFDLSGNDAVEAFRGADTHQQRSRESNKAYLAPEEREILSRNDAKEDARLDMQEDAEALPATPPSQP